MPPSRPRPGRSPGTIPSDTNGRFSNWPSSRLFAPPKWCCGCGWWCPIPASCSPCACAPPGPRCIPWPPAPIAFPCVWIRLPCARQYRLQISRFSTHLCIVLQHRQHVLDVVPRRAVPGEPIRRHVVARSRSLRRRGRPRLRRRPRRLLLLLRMSLRHDPSRRLRLHEPRRRRLLRLAIPKLGKPAPPPRRIRRRPGIRIRTRVLPRSAPAVVRPALARVPEHRLRAQTWVGVPRAKPRARVCGRIHRGRLPISSVYRVARRVRGREPARRRLERREHRLVVHVFRSLDALRGLLRQRRHARRQLGSTR
ncbi:hypothetical protein JB92DRAFT_2264046 [Gautieria morchelliformis]|nr:hypothetical protein JB92DRAFT_2264046 [Gautieria morchelliformis]